MVRFTFHLHEEVVRDNCSSVLSEGQNILAFAHFRLNFMQISRVASRFKVFDQGELQLLCKLHILDGSKVVIFFKTHSKFSANYHVAGPCPTQITLALKKFGCRMEIEKSLVSKVRLWASVADKQNLCFRVKTKEEVVGLRVALFEPFKQINLKIDVILGLIWDTPTFFIGHSLSLLNILYVESDSLA